MKKSTRNNIILLIVFSIPIFFINPYLKDKAIWLKILESVARAFGSLVAGTLGGLALAGIIYVGSKIHVWYLGMIEGKMEESIKFDEEWSFEKVFTPLFYSCVCVVTVAAYVFLMFGW